MNLNKRTNHRVYMRTYRLTKQYKKYRKLYMQKYYRRPYAKIKKNEQQRKYRIINGFPKKHPLMVFRSYIKCKYNLSLSDYFNKLKRQRYKCAICKIKYRYSGRRLSIDHNHTTGKIRGLLCHQCNAGLGNFKDNLNRIKAALNYLYRWD